MGLGCMRARDYNGEVFFCLIMPLHWASQDCAFEDTRLTDVHIGPANACQ